MSANNKITKIKTNINTWNEVRNTNIALNFLTSGNGFPIEFEDYQHWKNNNPTTLHCYFGVDEFELKFYLVDDVTDKNQSYEVGKTLVVKEFTRSFTTLAVKNNQEFKPITLSGSDEISKAEAEERILNWILGSKSWFIDQQNKNKSSILRLITIPFEDLDALFNSATETALAIMALKNFEEVGYNIELILTHEIQPEKDKTVLMESFYDVSQPRPPFTITSGFNLLE